MLYKWGANRHGQEGLVLSAASLGLLKNWILPLFAGHVSDCCAWEQGHGQVDLLVASSSS